MAHKLKMTTTAVATSSNTLRNMHLLFIAINIHIIWAKCSNKHPGMNLTYYLIVLVFVASIYKIHEFESIKMSTISSGSD